MSQIAHSQLALKKRSTPVTGGTGKANGHNEGGHKNDKDIIIIDDELYAAIPVGREEIVAEDETAGAKKKRNRRSKNSSDSRESSEFTVRKAEEVTPKQNKSQSTEKSPESVVVASSSPPPPPPAPVDDFPTPEASPKVAVGKLTTDALNAKRRSDRLQNASTIVNLSTVSSMDQSTKVSGDTLIASDETPSGERRVSGRRSTRPVDDLKYTYRTPDADDSLNATTNATIGSEIGNSMLLETPATDRKRRLDADCENAVESPKRSRLDLSALFNNFYSPVSILRNKFKRTNLASTPKPGGGAGLLDDSDASFGSDAAELKEVDLNENAEADIAAPVDNEVKIIYKPAKKSVCSIM